MLQSTHCPKVCNRMLQSTHRPKVCNRILQSTHCPIEYFKVHIAKISLDSFQNRPTNHPQTQQKRSQIYKNIALGRFGCQFPPRPAPGPLQRPFQCATLGLLAPRGPTKSILNAHSVPLWLPFLTLFNINTLIWDDLWVPFWLTLRLWKKHEI